jgi:molybdate transport system permease protein
VLAALVAMPLVLPPTVLGFYLLLLMGPQGPVGQLTQALGLGRLPFTFAGLVVASVIYSMPFVVQPLQQAFEAIPERVLEAAATCAPARWTASSPWRPAAGAARAWSPPACWALRTRWANSAWC